jgi:hypothetical protein
MTNGYEEFMKDFDKEVSIKLIKKSDDLVKDLARATPVDTGRAQAAWRLRNNAGKLEVVNEVEYINYLNGGSSVQAPAYFIERTALEYGVPHGTIVTPLT